MDNSGHLGAPARPPWFAGHVQHTLIDTRITHAEMVRHCEECLEFGFNAAMVSGLWVALARQILAGSPVRVASAVDFPIASMSTEGKRFEAARLVEAGAQELDIGVRIGALLEGRDDEFAADIRGVVEAVAPIPVKVMLELPWLDIGQRDRAVDLAVEAGAKFVKNASSGAVGTARVEDIRYLRSRVPAGVGVKASGGISTADHVIALLEAGADLVGTSHAVKIVAEALNGSAGSAPTQRRGNDY
jgi:deoxyribose-phosphate aldolase